MPNPLFDAFLVGRDAYNPLTLAFQGIFDPVTQTFRIQVAAVNSQVWVDAIIIDATGQVTIPNLAP